MRATFAAAFAAANKRKKSSNMREEGGEGERERESHKTVRLCAATASNVWNARDFLNFLEFF